MQRAAGVWIAAANSQLGIYNLQGEWALQDLLPAATQVPDLPVVFSASNLLPTES
jgi:hypothetical protein